MDISHDAVLQWQRNHKGVQLYACEMAKDICLQSLYSDLSVQIPACRAPRRVEWEDRVVCVLGTSPPHVVIL